MPRPSQRDAVLDAYAELLAEEGDRGTTLEAVAARAGMSKGGLLYHFAAKEALVEGLLQRLETLVADDLAQLAADPDGVVAAFLHTSVDEGSPLDRALVATARLAQDQRNALAADAIQRVEQRWRELVQAEVGDPLVTSVVMLLGDGLYWRSCIAVGTPRPDRAAIDDVIRAVGELRAARAVAS